MKRLVLILIGILMVIPAAFVVMQDNPPPIKLQITGINNNDYPTVVVNANVTDKVGQPVLGLGIDDFSVVGDLADHMKIVKVENVSDDSLSFSVVLAIDTSSSMDGTPIIRAKEAAIRFINSIGPTDPVAIVTFDNKARLVQDFTTDKSVLTNTINNLRYGGQTALYEGTTLAIQTAGRSPVPRRAVIILSDGQQYPSNAEGRGTGLENALQVGVPVYTIGEGFGYDRTFMTGLAEGSVAQFYESPSPEQLTQIYQALAQTLRSQYIITLTSDLPGDGKDYQLEFQVKDKNSATANADVQMHAKIYKPIVTLPDVPKDAIAETTTVTAQALSDDGIASATFQLDSGNPEAVDAAGPYSYTIDPANLKSGDHTLTFSATDTNGDTTSVTQTFTVALKPPTVTITGVPDTVNEVTTATITGASVEGTVQRLIVKINDTVVVSSLNKDSTTAKIDPTTLPPGENTMTAIVMDTAGGRSEFSIKFIVPAFPPTVTINGLNAGETITENRTITVDVASPQTPVNKVTYSVGGKVIATQTEEPFTLDLDVKTLGVGNHILTVEATNEGGASGKADVAFVIAPPPTATPTATSTSTNTPTATNTKVPPTNTKVPPTATDTALPATATNTKVAPTNTKLPPTANATETAEIQANIIASQAAVETAAARPSDTESPPTETIAPATSTKAPATNTSLPATDTSIPATNTTAPTDTKVPATNTTAPTNTTVPPTSTNTNVPPTSTSTSTATSTNTKVPPTSTSTATDTNVPPTTTSTSTATSTVTSTATEAEQTEVALAATNTSTATTTATSTNEATAVSTNTAQNVPTFTPIPLTAESQGTVGVSQSPLLIGATCLLGLLLLAIIYWFAARRRTIR